MEGEVNAAPSPTSMLVAALLALKLVCSLLSKPLFCSILIRLCRIVQLLHLTVLLWTVWKLKKGEE